MAKSTFEESAALMFVNDKEMTRLKKAALKDESLNKLIQLHDSFKDVMLSKPLSLIIKRIEYIESSLQLTEEWLDDGQEIEVYEGIDDEGNKIKKNYGKRIGILVDKSNGMSERTRDLIKELKDDIEDAMIIYNSKRKLLGGDLIEEKDLQFGDMSWTDLHASKKG